MRIYFGFINQGLSTLLDTHKFYAIRPHLILCLFHILVCGHLCNEQCLWIAQWVEVPTGIVERPLIILGHNIFYCSSLLRDLDL